MTRLTSLVNAQSREKGGRRKKRKKGRKKGRKRARDKNVYFQEPI